MSTKSPAKSPSTSTTTETPEFVSPMEQAGANLTNAMSKYIESQIQAGPVETAVNVSSLKSALADDALRKQVVASLVDDKNAEKAVAELRVEKIAKMTWVEYAKFLVGENWKAFLFGALAAVAATYLGRLALDWYNGEVGADAATELAGADLSMVA